jgi:S-adenosylmethionine hydrolase
VTLITLTTDFGTLDGYVGAMKGVIASRAPDARVIDITHDIPRQDVPAGALALANACPYYPAGTIHVAVVDPGVGTERKAVIVVHDEQFYIGPDNGIFSMVAPRDFEAFEIVTAEFRREKPSSTFHGRDIFAAAAAALATGGKPEDAGPQVVLRGKLSASHLDEENGRVKHAKVLHVDVFGNLISNIPAEKLPEGCRFRLVGREIARLSETYESVAEGEVLAYVGSRGAVEFAIRGGNAAEQLGAGRGTVIDVLPKRRPSASAAPPVATPAAKADS